MDKTLRTKLVLAFDKALTRQFSAFAQVKIKSMYIWPGETVWRREGAACSYFLILSPEAKGQSNAVTVELGWSRLKRFPELSQRPSLSTPAQLQAAASRDEGTVRIGSLCDGSFDLLQVDEPGLQAVVDLLMEKLKVVGMPFLDQIH